MDREQEELQSPGLLGTCSEFLKIISKRRKILLEITLTLILPLSLVFLPLVGISTLVSGKTPDKIFVVFSPDFPECLIDAAYFTFLLILMFPSTSAVVYTIACAYSSKEITYKSVMSAVPKVWKRLMVTFLCYFFLFVLYTILAFLFLIILSFLLPLDSLAAAYLTFTTLFTLYFIGLFFISMIWQLASVVSVIEDSYGFKAMAKSKALMKGKIGIPITLIYLVFNLSLVGTLVLFQKYVVVDQSTGVVGKAAFATICLVLLCALFFFGIVVQTLVYFVCKSCNHENIDKSTLSGHLETLSGEYVALKMVEGIHMEQV